MADQEQAKEQAQLPTPQLTFYRDPEDFEALYANQVHAESSAWDLKVIFGILDQSTSPPRVVQHTSINLPWVQVKILTYFMRANIAIHEAQNGKVIIPPSVMPPDPAKIDLVSFSADLKETVSKLYKEFISTL